MYQVMDHQRPAFAAGQILHHFANACCAGQPAAQAEGYVRTQIITKIDNISVSSIADYYSALESKRPGDTVSVTVHRDRKDIVVKVVLADPNPTTNESSKIRTYGI